jgi:hypothetical protein
MPSVIGQDDTASGFDPGLAQPQITFGMWGDSGSGAGIVGSSRPAFATAPARPDGAGVIGINNARGGGLGVWGQSDHQMGIGVLGTSADGIGVGGQSDGSGAGVIGKSAQGTGVVGQSAVGGIGVEGSSAEGTGVAGFADSGTGVEGTSTQGNGVSGTSRDDTAITGVSHDSIGISGRSGHSDSGGFGHGFAPNHAPGVFSATFNGDGVYGFSQSGVGVRAEGGTTGVTARGATLAGDFEGNVRVTGTLTKGGGGFKIDHPLDQESRYLAHSFVESREMKNFYDGVALLDANGEATIELPNWFEALNETFRYQITPIGAPAPRLHISRGLADGRFSIAGGEPQMEVCWQVTGVRRDAWALAHPLVVEEDKTPEEQGYYLHPQEHGQSAERDVSSIHHPARPRFLPADEVSS